MIFAHRSLISVAVRGLPLALLTVAPAAHAGSVEPQADVGKSTIMSGGSTATSDNIWHHSYGDGEIRMIRRFAACMVRSQPNRVRQALSAGVESTTADAALSGLAENNACLSGIQNFSFGNEALAGALAENLLKRDGKLAGLSDALAASTKATRPIAHDDMELTGVCVSQKVPTDVASLLAAEPDSGAETASLRAVGAALGGCVTGGQQVRFSKTGLRALMALTAYRIVNTSAQS